MTATSDDSLKRDQWIKLAAFFALIVCIMIVLLRVENMLLSSLIAFVVSYLLNPLVNAIERTGLSRLWATIIAFSLLTFLFVIGVSSTTPFFAAQLGLLKAELPKYIEGTTVLIQDIEDYLVILTGSMMDLNLSAQVEGLLVSWTSSLFEDLPAFLSKSLTTILLAPFLAFFLIKDGRTISHAMMKLVPNNIFELGLNLNYQINKQMGQFIRARLAEAAIVGSVVWLGLYIIGFPFATLLALFAALTNLIPYLGPFIGAIPAIVIALINGETGLSMLLMVSVYAIAQLIDIVFIIPLVVAKIVNLHPVTVMLAIIIGAQLMGILGMLISIPVASVIKVTAASVYQHLVQFRS